MLQFVCFIVIATMVIQDRGRVISSTAPYSKDAGFISVLESWLLLLRNSLKLLYTYSGIVP
jgi:hypothetical protein